jgi:hypothetical protein
MPKIVDNIATSGSRRIIASLVEIHSPSGR